MRSWVTEAGRFVSTLARALAGCALLAGCGDPAEMPLSGWHFTNVTDEAGLEHAHGYRGGDLRDNPAQATEKQHVQFMTAGVAAVDVDRDGWVDLYVVRGEQGPPILYRNRGDGSFEVDGSIELERDGEISVGPAFVDLNGDDSLDIVVGGIEGAGVTLYWGPDSESPDETYRVAAESGLTLSIDTFSPSFADYDRDGDIDVFLTHWQLGETIDREPGQLWRNNADGTFSDVSLEAGLESLSSPYDFSMVAHFADIDNDGWLDLLATVDFGGSRVYLNRRDGTFVDVTTNVIDDKNGMGAAVGDYDNDGDLDWFVSSISGEFGSGGNRLYRNDGSGGQFTDVTSEADVRSGAWAWGACFQDFNNDGHLDLFQVNGWAGMHEFDEAPARMFVSDGAGAFQENAADLGVDDRGQGRGVVCFDYDRDGDVDIFIANHGGPPSLYRNESVGDASYLSVRLVGPRWNRQGIGARVSVTANGSTQIRELRSGNNYLSQDPVEAHFGLGTADGIELVHVRWPSGEESVLRDIAPRQLLELSYPAPAD